MNRNKLKTYAPQARRDFIQAVTDRATQFGLTADKIEPMTEKGDVVLISGKPFPKAVGEKRKKLEARIKKEGFEQTVEAMAYTWFNRLVAIRFMELYGYLDHGFRVLSHPAGHSQPEILGLAQHVELAGLDQKQVVALKLDGNKEEELYRLLLLAQCNALHKALPFLFESLDDETELLLPDNLLHSDSLIRKLVGEIEDDDWKEVEIIGWMYQYYVLDEKKRVDEYSKTKPVESNDIPAKTQLFTPNWIVKYLVQNTLGRQWLATYPQSALRQQMEYYIEPTEQTPEVQEQLRAITPTSLNPEELTLLDPACGSGHILVEAYGLFKAIYEERGYRAKDIPSLILNKNLFGLEIDDRATQLAAFALMMKARADDRRIFDSGAKPSILALQDSHGMNAADITLALNTPILKEKLPPSEYLIEEIEDEENPLFSKKVLAEKGQVSQGDIASLLELFENAKTSGSLIQVPPKLAAKIPEIEQRLDDVLKYGDLTHSSARVLKPLLSQARHLARQYDAVVANPPYLGSNYFISYLKSFIGREYKEAKSDICVAFIDRSFYFIKHSGFVGMITMQSWMFLSSFESFRATLLEKRSLICMAHLGPFAFPQINGQVVQVTAFIVSPNANRDYRGSYRRLLDGSSEEKKHQFHETQTYTPNNLEFFKIPESPLAYWASDTTRDLFLKSPPLGQVAAPRQGMATTNNALFLRLWFEVDYNNIGFGMSNEEQSILSGKRWFPFNKGGQYRKWFGNNEYVVNYECNGRTICDYIDNTPGARVGSSGRVINRRYYFRPGITWTAISAGDLSVRYDPPGSVFSNAGMKVFAEDRDESMLFEIAGFLNSKVAGALISCLSETVNYDQGLIARLPVIHVPESISIVKELIELSRADWMRNETAWSFAHNYVMRWQSESASLSESFNKWKQESDACFRRSIDLENRNNELFILSYGLEHQISPEVSESSIVLLSANRQEDTKRLLSYAIGCMMGRYSLDKSGLILASQGDNLESYFLKASSKSESLSQDQNIEELDQIVMSKEAVNCFACGANSLVTEAKFVIAGDTTEEGQLHGRPLIYCAQCCDQDRASYVTMAMPLSQFNAQTALQQKWCEPETLKIFLNLADCFGKRIPLRAEEVKFLPDEDGILPLMEYSWFPDDAANRFERFIATAWPVDHLTENLEFVAESLGAKKGESAQETIRRYLAADFYKHHLSMYKKRPIYWLFSSGKQRGFQALVYLHRYNEGTLARMRTEYVVPLIGKMTARISDLGDEIEATSASPRKKKLTTDKTTITKQLAEVQAFEEKLRHYADQRIKLDLDDGVKVNYGKFGDLLADVKAVCGTKDED